MPARDARAMERLRDAHGQAASEYVALVALVAVALTLAAGLSSGGIGSHVVAGLQRALCEVAGRPCPSPLRPHADLAPCMLARLSRVERLSETIAVVRLGTSGTLSAARGSDGRVTVTLADGTHAGGELGAGVRLRLGERPLGASARAALDATWTSGRSWTFANAAAARAFVSRYGGKATIGGKLVDRLRGACSLLCDAIGWRPHAELPPPDETFEAGGAGATLAASLGVAAADAQLAAALGRRTARDGARTWYLRLAGEATAGLEVPVAALRWLTSGEAVASIAFDASGRPRSLGVSLAREAGADAALGAGRALRASASAGAGRAALVELEATLDLRDAANRAAAGALLRVPPRAGALRALAARIASHGQLDRRVYAIRRTSGEIGATVGLGLRLGAAFERTTSGLALVDARTRLPGLPFLPRDDCRAG
jgi:Flp pilus assembly pilin Flp